MERTDGYTRGVLIAAIVWLGLAAGLILVWQLVGALTLLAAGVLVAIFLRRLALWPVRAGLPYGWALAAVILLLLGFIAAAVWWRGPAIADQVVELQDQLPRAFEQIRTRIAGQGWGPALLERLPEPKDLLSPRRDAMAQALGVVSGVMSALGSLLVVVLTGIFLAATPGLYVRGFLRLVPPPKRSRAQQVIRAMEEAMGQWLVTKVLRMFFVAALTWAGLLLIGVPLALSLSIIAGLLTFVPNFGPIVAMVPAVLLGLAQGPTTALYVLLLYLAVQQVENYVVTPILEKTMLSLPPALTLAVQIALGVLAGPLGLALATPLTAAGVAFVRMVYVEDVLGDRPGEPAS